VDPLHEMFSLRGKSALVTGASRGIGQAIARGLGRAGASITITGRKADALQTAVTEMRAEQIDAEGRVCHQGDPTAIAALFDKLDHDQRTPSIVVVNAATNPVFGPLLDVNLDAWQKIVEVNLTGGLVTAQQAARRMTARGGGTIVFIASVAGLEPMAGLGAYSVSKAGLLGLMRAFAQELGTKNIRVNAIAPGLVETKFAAALFADQPSFERYIQQVPLGRHGQPTDLVGAALFLASSAATHITGQVIVVDGGRLLR